MDRWIRSIKAVKFDVTQGTLGSESARGHAHFIAAAQQFPADSGAGLDIATSSKACHANFISLAVSRPVRERVFGVAEESLLQADWELRGRLVALPRTFRHTLPMSLRSRLDYPAGSSQFLWKYYYLFLTRYFSGDDLVFLNLGYEEDPPMALPLEASDEPDRYFIQLYHCTATQADLKGKKVLEVSCGHGGGASYLVRTLDPASYTGLDLNRAGIDFCRKRHQLPGLDFVQGNAENLPFADQSFDAVINVEAAPYYPRFPRFLAEVARVLRPEGHFLYADLRPRDRIAKWEEELGDAPMRLISERVIGEQVARGLEKNVPRLQELYRHNRAFVPTNRLLKISHGLRSGEISYRMYCFAND
jgi:ubiquinone/menaquinone biosynthesis C-methylase UbiE